jgi:hypothetical protein
MRATSKETRRTRIRAGGFEESSGGFEESPGGFEGSDTI